MAYDEELAGRVRELLAGGPHAAGLTERKMFGGLAFLVGGHMAVAAVSSSDGMMVRCEPDDTEDHIVDGAGPMVMQGKELNGWLLVPPDRLTTDDDLAKWVAVGTSYTSGLPPKPPT